VLGDLLGYDGKMNLLCSWKGSILILLLCSWEQEVLVQQPWISEGAPVVRGDEAGSRGQSRLSSVRGH